MGTVSACPHPTLTMNHLLTLVLATAVLAAPEADPEAQYLTYGVNSTVNTLPYSTVNTLPYAAVNTLPYSQVAPAHTYHHAAPVAYTNAVQRVVPATYGQGLYPSLVHSYGKREAEAEAEADPQYLTYGVNTLPYSAVNTLPYNHVAPARTYTNVAPARTYTNVAPAHTYSHADPVAYTNTVQTLPATYTHSPLASTYAASPLVRALYQPATHAVTSYNSPTHYTAVSTAAHGPNYVARNGVVQHVVAKREAEAEAEPLTYINSLPYTQAYTQAYATPVVNSVYSHIPSTYAVAPATHTVAHTAYAVAPTAYAVAPTAYSVASPLVHNGAHGVVTTSTGAVHSSHVGICLNNVGVQVAC